MGLTAENVSVKYGVNREDQDAFALASHQKAIAAIDAGRFRDDIVPLKVEIVEAGGKGRSVREFVFEVDEGPRRDTSAESLAKLKPAFKQNGTVTAGNSSQMSDGAAAVVVMSAEKAKQVGLKPLARFVTYAGGVPLEIGRRSAAAIPKALRRLAKPDDIDLIELNEVRRSVARRSADAGDRSRQANVNGGRSRRASSGHGPLTTQLLSEMKRRLRWRGHDVHRRWMGAAASSRARTSRRSMRERPEPIGKAGNLFSNRPGLGTVP
jgi:acetyl-CoA acyltransferase